MSRPRRLFNRQTVAPYVAENNYTGLGKHFAVIAKGGKAYVADLQHYLRTHLKKTCSTPPFLAKKDLTRINAGYQKASGGHSLLEIDS